jgi:hypothetical protein
MSLVLPSINSFDPIEVTIGVDPGLGGAIAALMGDTPIVWSTPVIVTKIRKKTKNKGMHDMTEKHFDLEGMLKILRTFQVANSNVLFAIEKVGVMGHDANRSAFSFGEGYGYWKMAAVSCGFKMIEVRPQKWKEFFPDLLASTEISDIRASITDLKAKSKELKGNKAKKGINKEIATLARHLKAHAKDAAREYAAKMYPSVADSFKLKKDDGKAEAVLLANYAKHNYR